MQILAKISVQVGDFEAALKFFIKSIEILEDLHSAFHVIEIDKKYKTKLHFLYMANRLSKFWKFGSYKARGQIWSFGLRSS